ncbi:MAG TPA: glycosyltransferase family 1 protein, partial [Verrucomicrobiae bacterium]|nr:glycosyltransferase family 1 protein [Verrucomicrobiae bacterium]
MRIFYDGRIFQMQKAGGINRYFAEVISGLPAEYEPLVTGVEDFGNHAPNHPNLKQPRLKGASRPGIAQFYDAWWKPQLLRGVDVFHPTYYDVTWGYALEDFKGPLVVTVYDFVYAWYAKVIDGSDRVLRDQRKAVERADHVVCISKATEEGLLERFPEKRGKTSVSYLGSSFEVQPPVAAETIFEQPTFLFVGGRGGYKNFSFLLRAFAKAREVNGKLRLRVAGSPLTGDEKWQLYFLGLTDAVEVSVFPSEADLMKLYRSSVALVYPSLHEGFGIPPLEAMACRTLAITSNTTSLPEVVGDGGIMLDPLRENDWVEAMLKAAQGGGERGEMIERG